MLIADDEQAIADTLALIVEDAGYQPCVAANGEAALALALERWPSVVITDLMMPNMDGESLIHALRHEARKRGVAMPPVILLTASARSRADAVGADVVVTKPFDVLEAEELLKRLMERSTSTPGM